MKRLSFAIILYWLTLGLHAQEAALENTIAANYSHRSWKFNTSIGHRAIREKLGESTNNRLAFLEINQFITRRIYPRISVSLGYKYRDLNNESSEIEHRLTQQVAISHTKEYIRLVSRLRIEQRFRDQFAHRYRYRFSFDMPLSGIKLDSKECYLVASNELILQLSKSRNNFDNRLSLGLGYMFSSLAKLQLDLTHRMENINSDTEHIPFINTSLLFNIN